MDEVIEKQVPAKEANKLTKEERSKVMSEAATRRWAKVRKEKDAATKVPAKSTGAIVKSAGKPVVKAAPRNRASAPREFSTALKTAEKRLAGAILERAKAANTYAVLSAEIPSLQRIILALKNPLGVLPEQGSAGFYAMPAISAAPTLEQIVGDQPFSYQNPPRRESPMPQVPVIPIPQTLHPANTMAVRGGGGAIGIELGEPEEVVEDEDRFLKESTAAGGEWH